MKELLCCGAACLLLAGCGAVKRDASAPPVQQASVASVVPAPPASTPAPPPPPAPSKGVSSSAPAPKAPPAAPAPPPLKAPPAAPAPIATRPVAPPLDLRSLEQRLKDTGAIGVLTKLSLKNQVDDLIAKFQAFHAGKRPPTLAELRQPFELLLMKVLSLLQDRDAALASDINASREAIWGVLADARALAQFT